ncbi:MAG: hypothetical protein NTY95_14000 [Bacteroidia bacterium]|nr:hypothetical protein [Bacteroidia bacterium]
MKKLFYITGLTLICNCLSGQLPVGSWSDHLRYNTANRIAGNSEEIYASTGSSILVYNSKYNELRTLSPVNGLSQTGISSIGWSDEHSMLIIAYTNTNLDLIDGNSVHNIPDIYVRNIQGNNKINRIRTLGKYAYLATGFGIVVVDMVRMEIHDTWRPGPGADNNEVFDIAFGNSKIYAATGNGLWQADLSNQGLAYFGNWDQITSLPEPDLKCTHVIFSGETLYCNISQGSAGDIVYAINGGTRLFSFYSGVINSSFDIAPQGFTISSASSLKYYKPDGSLLNTISSYGWGVPDISQGIVTGNYLWVADKNYGLVKGENMTAFTSLSLPGPATNDVENISSLNGKTILCAGGTDKSWNGMKRSFQVSVHENNKFINIVQGSSTDAMRSFIDPWNSSHFFISSWGSGLFEYENNILMNHYNSSNSPLQISGTTGSEIKVCGLAMDKLKNLWITQTNVTGSVKILKPGGSWIVYPLTIDAPVVGDIISTENGQKWITLPGSNGLYIIDDNNTPDVFPDDRTRKLTVTDSDDKVSNSVFSAAEDLDGNIWIGTDQGPVIYYNTDHIFEGDVRGYRIKVPRNDGSGLADYMLGTESITAISVDGANRKWLGTKSSGAYMLSADGTTVLKNYNVQNSPIFSDSIASVAVDNKTGEVWFGTSEGVLSVREIATSGRQSFIDVYSFPNPVREDYSGNVTITGLMKDTQVKITDISGNLVYETMSEGGQASWDLNTYNGHRVRTGVYLAFCANNDGSESCVTKILVIGR